MAQEALLIALRCRRDGRSLRAYARHLGVSTALLGLLLQGRYSLGSSAARRIAAVYPELLDLLADAVMDPPTTTVKETA